MTIEEIDAKIAQIEKDMGKYNFCITFELMDIQRLKAMREQILKGNQIERGAGDDYPIIDLNK